MSNETQVAHRPKILIVEDEPGPQEALRLVLSPFFEVYWADSADAALRAINEIPDIDVITLDLVLPGRSGVELLNDLKRDHESIEVIVLTGYGALLSAMDCFRHGAAAYLIKPFDQMDVLREINVALVIKHKLQRLRACLADLRRTTQGNLTPETARRQVAKNPRLLEHAEAVCRYALQLADRLHLSSTDRQHVELGALLHDIGLLAIDDPKHPQLRDLSLEEIQHAHTQVGARMAIAAEMETPIVEIIQYHHERYDGSGYPHHLLGEDIPYLARVVAIANSVEHLTSTRASTRLTQREVQAFLKLHAGSRFDPWLAELWQPS